MKTRRVKCQEMELARIVFKGGQSVVGIKKPPAWLTFEIMQDALGDAIVLGALDADSWNDYRCAGGLFRKSTIREMLCNPSSRLIWQDSGLSPYVYLLQIRAVRAALRRIYNDPQERDLEVRAAWLANWREVDRTETVSLALEWYPMPDRRRANRHDQTDELPCAGVADLKS